VNCKKRYEGGFYEARAFCAWKASLFLCVLSWKVTRYFCQNTTSFYINNHNFEGLVFFSISSLIMFHSADAMIVCSNCCECNLKFFLETRECLFKVMLKSMSIQLNKKRLSNFKSYYSVIIVPLTLGEFAIVKMIFCKRRIGVTNFSGYYNRKRVRRRPG